MRALVLSPPIVRPEVARARYPHGTRARATLGRCKCFPCRLANTAYETARMAPRRLPWRVRHTGYGWWIVQRHEGGPIAHKTRDREEAYRERDRLNEPHRVIAPNQLVSVKDVRRHLRWLAANGIGLRTVERVSGVARSVLQRMYDGNIRRTRHATAERIMAVTLMDRGGASLVDGSETWSLIGCLLEAGWQKARIARALGCGTPSLQLRKDHVLARTARAVEELHWKAWTADPRIRQLCPHEVAA